MAEKAKPRRVRPVKGFAKVYREFLKKDPSIKDAMHVFNINKRKIPPEPLPRGMKDHQLLGKWKDFHECHLAPNILLLYKQKGDLTTLINILPHDALK